MSTLTFTPSSIRSSQIVEAPDAICHDGSPVPVKTSEIEVEASQPERLGTPRAKAQGGKKKAAWDKIEEQLVSSLERIESGESIGEWQRMWDVSGGPQQSIDGHIYSGKNAILTMIQAAENGWGNQWTTFARAKALGGSVLKGEASTTLIRPIPVKPKKGEESESDDKDRQRIFWGAFPVFNVDQTNLYSEGIIPKPIQTNERPPIDGGIVDEFKQDWQKFTTNFGERYPGLQGLPTFSEGGDRAFYRPADNHIQMPICPDSDGNLNQFHSLHEYMCTDTHEKFHYLHDVTGLSKRAEKSSRSAKLQHADEEQVVESAALFHMTSRGYNDSETFANSTRYIVDWNGQAAKMSELAKTDVKALVGNLSKARDLALLRLGVTDDNQYEVNESFHSHLTEHYGKA